MGVHKMAQNNTMVCYGSCSATRIVSRSNFAAAKSVQDDALSSCRAQGDQMCKPTLAPVWRTQL